MYFTCSTIGNFSQNLPVSAKNEKTCYLDIFPRIKNGDCHSEVTVTVLNM